MRPRFGQMRIVWKIIIGIGQVNDRLLNNHKVPTEIHCKILPIFSVVTLDTLCYFIAEEIELEKGFT